MASWLVRQIAGYAPPALRRSLAGALIDLKGLNSRLADPSRRREPWAFIHNVGDGDFHLVGAQIKRSLIDHAGLTGSDSVLDIGCGNGRVAAQLAPLLQETGSYVGFDISRGAIYRAGRRFSDQAHMRFVHLDVWNGEYNPSGRMAELDAVFPVADRTIDLAFAASVFTHMRMAALRRYLSECARVLKPGGRLAFTCFALQPERESSNQFAFVAFDETSAVIDPRIPERAIAHQRLVLEAAVADAGLEITHAFQGHWAPGGNYDGGQDLFVATKA